MEIGGLVVKAKLDDLPTNSLLGAFVSLKEKLIQNPNIQDHWTKIGKNIFDNHELR
ncbi:conjugal transfer protein TraD [Rickettsia endosymbiont of Seladonia tumulorum]|uniref:conjugal transfer protein TraD n=1 Tax=Rickettsia endosymbiont of Seladonia tumulorum TaxID=3066270 RepID=UPI00397974DF